MTTPYASQFGQDAFLDRFVFRGSRDLYFVDVGAHDGEHFSNSVFFERHRGWRGLCVEPNPAVFDRLSRVRRADCVRCCVSPIPGEVEFIQVSGPSDMLSGMAATYAPEHLDRLERAATKDNSTYRILTVPSRPLASLLDERGVREVHFLSIDTEGGEAAILASLDFERCFVHAISIENNYAVHETDGTLRRHGFIPMVRLAVDTVYLNPRSPFYSWTLTATCLGLRAMARVERKLRKLRLLPAGEARFAYKAPR